MLVNRAKETPTARRSWHDFPNGWNIGMFLGVIILVIQILNVVHCQFRLTSFFCWDPHNAMIRYEMNVIVDDEALTPQEIRHRYGIAFGLYEIPVGWEVHDIQNIFHLVEITEARYHQDNPAEVTIRYSVNRGEEQSWHYPGQ